MAGQRNFIDSVGARLIAGIIVLGCAGLLLFLNWHVLYPPPAEKVDDAKLNPEFVACRDSRLADVNKMKSDGVINDQQFAQFTERAVATCAGQFPSGG